MKKRYVAALTVLVIILCSINISIAKEVDKAKVQGAMSTYIEAKTAKDGGYDINGVLTEFDYIHSGVDKKGALFVSCADFKSGSELFDIDYYVKSEDGHYLVVKEVLHKKNGKRVDEVLWQAK